MKLRVPESPVQRMAMAIGAALVLMFAGGLIYMLMPNDTATAKINGSKIVTAASAFTRDLIARKQPIPISVSLNELLKRGFLKPSDVAPFQGLDASLMLAGDISNPHYVVMRVHLPDGSDLLLQGDGSMQQVAR